MSQKSIEQIWQQIEAERQQRLSNEKIAYEQQILESEKQRQAYLNDVSMNESIFSVGVAAAAGGGGQKRTISSSGQATLFKFEEDNLNKYLIYNFDTQESTGVLSFGLDTDYYNQFSLSVTGKGFVEVFGNNSSYVIIALDLSGNIKSRKTISTYTEYYGIDARAIILYNENDLYYAFDFDGLDVRIHEFIESISLDDNYDPYFNGGYILHDELNYYLVPNTGNPILIHTIEENTSITIQLYAYSTTFSLIVYDSNSCLSEMKIYNSSGTVLLTYNFKNVSNILHGLNSFNFISESNGIILSSYDNVSLFYIFYYSPESNTVTYRSTDLPNRENFSGLNREYDDNNNQICTTSFYVLYSGSYNQSNGLWYYDSSVFILPIFKGDTEIRELVEITNDSKSLSFTYLKMFDDKISMLVDNGNATYDLMNINSNGTVTYTLTDIDYAEPFAYYLLSERSIFYLNNSLCILSNTGITQSLTGITSVSGYATSRNTFVVNSNSNTYYTNSAVGNTFILLDNYYENSDIGYKQVTNDDGYRSGNILVYNYENQVAQIISDEFESSVINIELIDASINKQTFYLGENYLGVLQDTSQDSIPYTHTKLSVSGPVDSNDFITDGIILSGSGYFSPIASSPSSAYFTNLYPGLFVMVADQCSIDSFGINGNLGADGSGSVDSHDFIISDIYSLNYAVYSKRVYDATDPSVNHIMIVENKPGIEHIYTSNTDSDIDTLTGISECYRIHYLLFSKVSGGYVTNNEIEQIANAYLSIVDDKTLEDILTQLNLDYANVTNPIINDIYYFSDNGDPGAINDGGNDMYDTGNKMVSSVGEFVSVVLAYYNLEGEEVNRLDSIVSQSIEVDDVFGDRYYGLYLDKSFVFSGGDIILYTFPTNELDTELNDFYWWND